MKEHLSRLWMTLALFAVFHLGAAPLAAMPCDVAAKCMGVVAHHEAKCPCCVHVVQHGWHSSQTSCACRVKTSPVFVVTGVHVLPVQFDLWLPLVARPAVEPRGPLVPCVYRPRNNGPPRGWGEFGRSSRAPPA